MPVKVILWAPPRSVSTAFERAIQEVNNVKVFHEPYLKACFLGPDKQIPTTYPDQIDKNTDLDMCLSYQDVQSLITAEYSGKDVFVKDMTLAVADNFAELFLNQELQCITHTFLIRSPEKAVKSFYEAFMKDPPMTEFDAGLMVKSYEKQFEFYNFIVEKLNQQPVIVDADDLLNQPGKILREYCNKTGLTYHENMVNWKLPASDDMKRVPWKIFHKAALESEGFQVPKKKDYSFIPEDIMEHIDECIAKCQEPYNAMYDLRLKI